MVFAKKAAKASDEKKQEPVKTDRHCAVDGCFEEKAPGQTYVCAKHVRSN